MSYVSAFTSSLKKLKSKYLADVIIGSFNCKATCTVDFEADDRWGANNHSPLKDLGKF